MTKRFGFTLAEVLITLGIIGVVAAMTMPTLMNSTNGAQYKTAYKKALSVISQAVVLNIALDEWSLADTVSTGTDTEDLSVFKLLDNRMNVVKTSTEGLGYKWTAANTDESAADTAGPQDDSTSNYALFFNDGIAISFPNTAVECSMDTTRNDGSRDNACLGIIDVNGQKAPNKQVKCDSGSKDSGCEVKNPTDIYPVIMFDQQILPNSAAAKAVLYAK